MPVPRDRLLTARDLFALKFVGDPQLAPDGASVAFVVTTVDEEHDTYRSRLWLVATDGKTPPRPLTGGAQADTAPRWSPDGRQLVFLSTRGGKPQLYLLPIGGGEARQLTDLPEGAGEPAWSPDGRRIAFSAAVAHPAAKADDKDAAGEPLRIERLQYKSDGRGFVHGKPAIERWRHLFVVEVPPADGTWPAPATQLTDGDWHDDAPAWSPDGTQLAFTSYREPDADSVLRNDIWTVAAADRRALRRLTRGDGSAGAPSWSPDGATLAYFGTLEADRPFATSRPFTVAASGAEAPRAVAPNFDRDANAPVMSDQTLPGGLSRPLWSADGHDLLFVAADGGNHPAVHVPASGGSPEPLLAGERAITALTTGPAGSPLVFGASDGTRPAELFAADADGANERRLTDFNGPFLAGKTLSPPERLRFPGGGGDEIDGWLIPPVGATPGTPYPLILMIHGGPHAQYGTAFMHEFQLLAARGYGVLFANPHGSSGRGAAFAKALAAGWGERDFPDLMAAVDHVLARGEVDPARLGVGGGSYGGYMTNWVIGHTDRFKAAVSMRSISNLLNFWGTSDLFHLGQVPEFGLPWEQPERYAALSPIMYAGNFVTPTLILHQEEDHRCPIEQGEQLFAALKLRGVPARFVRFPAESHGMSRNGKPRHRLQRLEEIITWYDRHLA